MPQWFKQSCDQCDFSAEAHEVTLYVVCDDGSEAACGHPLEEWAAKEATGCEWDQLSREDRFRGQATGCACTVWMPQVGEVRSCVIVEVTMRQAHFAFLLAVVSMIMAVQNPVHSQNRNAHARRRFDQGVLFTVHYPATFRALPGKKSVSDVPGGARYDSASFRSPDNRVEFYVSVPWDRTEPANRYVIDPRREVLIARRSQRIPYRKLSFHGDVRGASTVSAEWVTVRAKNGKYTRSWVETNVENNTNPIESTGYASYVVFGIRYRDRASLQKYQREYIAFKKSLDLEPFCPE